MHKHIGKEPHIQNLFFVKHGFFKKFYFFITNIPDPELSEGSDVGPDLTFKGRLA
jgi:hypothetical protein